MESLRVDSMRGISTRVLVVMFGYRQCKENYRFMFVPYIQNAHLISETCAIIIYIYIYIYTDAQYARSADNSSISYVTQCYS